MINLKKQETVSLTKDGGQGLSTIFLGLGWDVVKPKGLLSRMFQGEQDIDLDASCLMLSAERQILDAVWFRQLQSKDGSVVHSGDNRTGKGKGDDETISVDLRRVPAQVHTLVFTVSSFLGQTFDKIDNAVCRLVDTSGDQREVARLTLSEKGSHTGLIMAKVQRGGAGWKLTAIGERAEGRTVNDLAQDALHFV